MRPLTRHLRAGVAGVEAASGGGFAVAAAARRCGGWLAGPGDVTVLARGILSRGPKVVFITEGAEGARAITASGERRAPARKVTVADTVGAGDTFNAGVLAALHEAGALTKSAIATLPDLVLDAALDLGIRAAAITVSRPGANPPWRHEL